MGSMSKRLHALTAISLATTTTSWALFNEHPQQQVLQASATHHTLNEEYLHVEKELQKAEIIPTVIDDFLPSVLVEAEWSSSSKSKPKASAQLGNTIKPELLQDAPTVTLRLATSHGDSHNDTNGDDDADDSSAARANATNMSTLCVLSANVSYVLTLTDPDAPSRDDPKWSEFCHWIATGLAEPSLASFPSSTSQFGGGGCLSAITFSPSIKPTVRGDQKLDNLIEYKPPSPPEKTGQHRYVFLVFVPANGTTEKLHLSKPGNRQRWGYDDDQDDLEDEAGWEENGRVGVRRWARENGLIAVGANFIYAQNKKQ